MQKISLQDIQPGEHLLLARPVLLGSGVKGFNSGIEVTERVLQKLIDLGFMEVWVRGEDEEETGIIHGEDEAEVSQTEKFLDIKMDVANQLADIMTEKDPEREMLRIRQSTRSNNILKKGSLTKIDPERSLQETKVLKQFSESIISIQKLESFASYCYDLLEGPFSSGKIDSVLINLNDNRIEGSYLFNHMANSGLYFLATIARYNADLKKKGAVSSELKYSSQIDRERKKDMLFYFTDDEIVSAALGAFMHDIGYLHDGMPEILFKEGQISFEEHGTLKKHVEVSMNIIQYHTFFNNRPLARNVVENHHERLDGKGYPKGRSNFHVFSRALGMIDCFDSMTTNRPWRKKFSRAKVLEWLYDNSEEQTDADGTMHQPMFDRDLLLCFERILMLYENSEIVDLYHVKSTNPVFKCKIVEQSPGRPDRPSVELISCYPDPNKPVAGKVLNLVNSKDLYLGESTDFRKERIV
ncbi:MAG TPA: HD domain-containing protein [bacterium]|nr:HD domain-containing protein [bacterium]